MKITWQNEGGPVSMKSFLSRHGISMRLIKDVKHGNGDFLVNNQAQTGVITVAHGDSAGIELPAEAADPLVASSDQPIDVLAEDENWLVVAKPAGLTSVPGPSDHADTLVNRVKGYLIREQAENLKPHLITRLDRDTSGLVLVAKHRVAQSMLTNPAVAKSLTKTYLAWVSGVLTPASGLIQAPIGRPTDSPRRAVMATGQAASTKYWVEQTFGNQVTQVKLALITGRTHQIRVHLTSLGHPLLGDELYGGDQALIQRQALHAATLAFDDPFSGQHREFAAPLPADLAQLVTTLNKADIKK
ncbi:RluA family pseudouridine synthase [Lactiplantibacillus nangangensis]|uniref:Pseudouridine synthase n=1 Tax=Lactiplantibacillus nangangensis TaxID=2559917 RepID=A0ABW1SMZ9_9LACO|nr:RluA family pseudouridine synthase [Lactiplantibacillus nangangensis]